MNMPEIDVSAALAAVAIGRTAKGLPPMTEDEWKTAQIEIAKAITLFPSCYEFDSREKRKDELAILAKDLIYCNSIQMIDRVLGSVSDELSMDLRIDCDLSASLGDNLEKALSEFSNRASYLLSSNFYKFKIKRGKGKGPVRKRLPYREDQLRYLLAEAIDIFEKWARQFPASTPDSPGWVFLTEVAKAAGYRNIDMTRQIREMAAILHLSSNDLDARYSEARWKRMQNDQATDEEHDGGGVKEGLCGSDGALEVAGEPVVAVKPGEGPFHHPAPWLHGEADLAVELVDNLRGDAGRLGDAFTSMGSGGEDLLDAEGTLAGGLQGQHSTAPVVDPRQVAAQQQRESCSIDHDGPLTAFDLLARVIATRTSGLGGPDALAVDHRSAGAGVPT